MTLQIHHNHTTDSIGRRFDRAGSEVSVFHNMCGHRTTFEQCRCAVNRRLQAEEPRRG